MEPLVSVIVPVYNASKYLRRCVESLCAQTYENIEILLVDDGSTDGSGAICDEYSQKDSRIRVIHQENQGQSAARNTGLDAMYGEYVMFCDDDDYVSPDFVRYPIERLVPEKGDIACFQHYEDRVDGLHRIRGDCFASCPANAVDAKKMYIAGKVDGYVWNKAFHRALWENIRFPVGMEAEDIAVVLSLFMAARKILFLDVPLYYWNRRNAFSRSRWGAMNAWVAFCAFLVKMEFEKAAQQIGDDELLRNVRVKNLYEALRVYYKNSFEQTLGDKDAEKLLSYLHSPWVKDILSHCHRNVRIQYWVFTHVPLLSYGYGWLRSALKARQYHKNLAGMEH